jgi:hypothetical protein
MLLTKAEGIQRLQLHLEEVFRRFIVGFRTLYSIL